MSLSQTSQQVSIGGGLLDSGLASFQVASPALNTVVLDTGPLAGGTYRFFLMIFSTVSYNPNNWAVQHRDAANAANLHEFFPSQPATSTAQIQFTLEVAANERVRMLNPAAFASTISGVLSWEKVA